MSSIAEQLDEARKDELLDLTLHNPLISHDTLKSRGAKVIDERPTEVYRILVEEGRKMSFLEVSEEEKEKLRSSEEGPEMIFGQPDEGQPDEGQPGGERPKEEEAEAGATGTAERHVDTKLQTPYTSAELQKRLRGSYHHARRSVEEKGINTLFLALGMLRWHRSSSAETKRKAPILLVPVELSRTDVQGRFRVEYLGEEIGGNLSLKAFLDGEFGIDWPLPPDPQEGELDLQTYAGRVRDAIQHKSRWHLDLRAIELGFFSFSRFLMYEDLRAENWPEGERPGQHPVLQKLLGEGFEADRLSFDKPSSEKSGRLDEHLKPEETFHVVDADSSQTEAILSVKEGQDLVLQGPPGTGKSQTITNVIAEAIAEGKTVLFASEKMAALEVVKRNLDEAGLGDACLELHSHKTRKKAVLKELGRTLSLGKPQVEDFSDEAAIKMQAREKLNAYADAVNEPIGESGVRPYDAYGRLEQLRESLSGLEVPPLKLPAMREWTSQEYKERKLLIEQLESHLSEMGVPAEHPFWGSRRASAILPDKVREIEDMARSAGEALAGVRGSAGALAERLGLEAPTTPEETGALLRAGRQVLQAPSLTGVRARSDAWVARPGELSELVEAGKRYSALREEHGELLIPEAWDQDVLGIRQGLAKHGGKWYRWLIGEWREAKGDLAGLCKAELPAGSEERIGLVDGILESQRLKEQIEEASALAEEAFGRAWRGLSSDWEALQSATSYLTGLHDKIEEGSLPAGLLSAVSDPPDEARLRSLTETLEEKRESLQAATETFASEIELDEETRFGGERLSAKPLSAQPHAVQEETFERCRKEAPRIQEILTYNQLTEDLSEEGLGPIAEAIQDWEEAPSHLVDAFERAYYNALLERALGERPALGRFSGAQHEEVAKRFRELDKASLEHNRHELALKHYERMPPKKGVGQMGVLLHEMGKKSRHMPIRKLMDRAGSAIQAIKPVFMMSPMSVPKYLPPESVDFDLVVFDEASQVRPVDAFGSILRGDQAVVVGDSKQLPPTSFFESSIDTSGEGYERRAGDQESILDLFRSRGAPEQMLKFHYRSRHESLIAVSNKEFYDNDLNVFPSPDAGQEETGLFFNHLPGVTYDRGGSRKNKGEAEVVADRVMEHARQRPDMSLGVATFSSAQQEAIRDRLEHERRQDPSCEDFFSGHPDEPFFVKNLESVQGDQRDVIFISVGYGRDEDGRVTMDFGPLNQDGGERRLNVLTTRAKYRCEVFTNLKAEDIDLSRTDARGVEVLKEYLKFAETGELDLATPSGRGPDSPFEEAVADRLREKGYDIEHQVGVAGFYIDLAVRDPERPGRYLLGIECDGATYHSARMARVRDRTRQAVLENLGWTIHRIWSTDWFRNPGEQLGKTVQAIERASLKAEASAGQSSTGQAGSTQADPTQAGSDQAGPNQAGPDQESSDQASPDKASTDQTGVEPAGGEGGGGRPPEKEVPEEREALEEREAPEEKEVPQKKETEIRRASGEEEDTALQAEPYEKASLAVQVQGSLREQPTRALAQWIREVVEAESPVHEDVAARRVADAAGAGRMGSRIQEALSEAIDYAARKGWVKKKRHLLSDPDQEEVPVRDRSDVEGEVRDIEHVPGPEIAEAARRVAEISFSIEKEELVQQVGRQLGFGRVGSNIRERIGSVIDTMLSEDMLTRENGRLAVSESEPSD
ncbi:very-short-patch-repair endonuclease/DNA polymerase III delta prime subunit [Salinibacter ruber]|nr:DUF3320 domain-containing protein [Salinibacter ruber]MCS4155488.1 very-short-patch-repair endonuclease/DNA polymerase III delta prime subunit [Salinibacter ruber]